MAAESQTPLRYTGELWLSDPLIHDIEQHCKSRPANPSLSGYEHTPVQRLLTAPHIIEYLTTLYGEDEHFARLFPPEQITVKGRGPRTISSSLRVFRAYEETLMARDTGALHDFLVGQGLLDNDGNAGQTPNVSEAAMAAVRIAAQVPAGHEAGQLFMDVAGAMQYAWFESDRSTELDALGALAVRQS